ncbi:hypothetical protein [Parageobacillus toebii]|nr:hypothetical protein [Parageobacillus toebii]
MSSKSFTATFVNIAKKGFSIAITNIMVMIGSRITGVKNVWFA